ncbi:rhomboid-domain-containing protein [Clavulina sp. PMI_390]|nr:rhomboid-domain-containing protein [Clavulina sp. PMI_390]
MFGDTSLRHPLEQRIENRRRGVTRQSRPFISWALAAVMGGVLIYELVYNSTKQGSPISLKPYVNYMLGPSQVGLISLGARWPACMRIVPSIPLTLTIGCPSNVDNPPTKLCSIEQLCAHGGFHNATPNQWWRFITPIFLHAGIIHYAFNMFAQLTVSAQVEREIGSIGFFILYFTAGIFGNILGGNFALVGLPSVGASGAIFGTVGVLWVDLLAHWGIETQPGKKLAMLCVDLVVGVALGYIPGVDNFVHLGGFLAGLICAAIFLPVISTTKLHKSVMWGVRIGMIPLIIVLYVVLLRNFYTTNPFAACNWCRYLSCIPTSSNNQCQGSVFLVISIFFATELTDHTRDSLIFRTGLSITTTTT